MLLTEPSHSVQLIADGGYLMFSLPRLPPEYQRNVGTSLDEHFKTKPTYTVQVTKSGRAVIDATPALGGIGDPSMFTIDVATDSVVTAIYRIGEATQKGLTGAVIQLSAAQEAQLRAATTIEEAWFAHGVGFVRDPVAVQYATLTTLRDSLSDPATGPELKAAIQTLGIGPLVDHLLAHIRVYGKKLGLVGEVVHVGDDGSRDPSDIWHDAYVAFAIDVMAAYRDNADVQQTLLGSYESQLQKYRGELAKKKKKERQRAKAEAEAEATAAAKPTTVSDTATY